MPVIRLYGFGDNMAVTGLIREFREKFRQASKDGLIPSELAEDVALVQVYSSANMIISGENAQYVEIYASSETPDSDLITLAKFVRERHIIGDYDIDIEIIWADGTRAYLAKGKEIPDARPPKSSA